MGDFNEQLRALVRSYPDGLAALARASGVQQQRISAYLDNGLLRSDSIARLCSALGAELLATERGKAAAVRRALAWERADAMGDAVDKAFGPKPKRASKAAKRRKR